MSVVIYRAMAPTGRLVRGLLACLYFANLLSYAVAHREERRITIELHHPSEFLLDSFRGFALLQRNSFRFRGAVQCRRKA